MDKKSLDNFYHTINQIRAETKKVVVGQDHVITGILRGLVADGHILVEGIPGIAKTLLVRTIAKVTGCQFGRVQFTVDLLPSDIVGIQSYQEGRGFFTIKGPIFANFLLADEINRAPPKTQSALLEAMQEKQVTLGKERFPLLSPFFVMATQNPIEQEGTYRLPEAQMDRFLFKVIMGYPSEDEERQILKTNITLQRFEDFDLKAKTTPAELLKMQQLAKEIYTSPEVENYIIRIVEATRNPNKYKLKLAKYIEYGCSPRASIGLFIGSKAEALIQGKTFVTPQHVKDVALDVMRHRLILSYEAEAENITSDHIIKEILARVPVP
ncbi:MoxR family ATPase [Candidatus Woesearchaeota archaeon]|nr:MoxR family ATPase [Candidatus Woesearchaeota archaeon]